MNYNYRLGPLGFPQGNEAARLGELNLALRDQIAALEWVQENIHVFGGDKNKVRTKHRFILRVMGGYSYIVSTGHRFWRERWGYYDSYPVSQSFNIPTSQSCCEPS